MEAGRLRLGDRGSRAPGALNTPTGGGTFDGMGPWEVSVDKRLDQLHADHRDLLRFGIGAFVMAFSAIIVSFFLLSAKIEQSGEKIGDKIDGLTAQVSGTNERVSRLEGQAAVAATPKRR